MIIKIIFILIWGDGVNRESERLRVHLAKNGLKLTRQREIILEADHITAEELHRELSRKKKHLLGLATIYRTLKLLCEVGIAQERHFGDTKTLYDNVSRKGHHDHLICNQCGRITEFESRGHPRD